MARFRLRFLLHEFDLPSDEVYIGRSASCELTVDDPLVSRKHARLFVKGGEAWVEDLGSRNGVRVNGRPITSPTVLKDGASLRIGTQEMRLRRLEEEKPKPVRRVATGFLIHCTNCGRPYGTDEATCPHCGEEEALTSGGMDGFSTEAAWSMELLVETLNRASGLGRVEDVERLLTQAEKALLQAGNKIDRRRLDQFAQAAVEVAIKNGSADWARWALQLFSDRGLLPRLELGKRLSDLPPSSRETLSPQLDELIRRSQQAGRSDTLDVEARDILLALSELPPASSEEAPTTRTSSPDLGGESN